MTNERTRPQRRLCGIRGRLACALSTWSVLAALGACASVPASPQRHAVTVCAAGACREAGASLGERQLLQALHRLLEFNDGAELRLCRASVERRDCTQGDIGYFVLGSFVLPGRGSSGAATMRQVEIDPDASALRYRMSMALRFLGIPFDCAEHAAVLSVKSVNDVSLVDDNHRCPWLVAAVMSASFSFQVDAIDLDHGRLAGRWRHGVTGMGIGRGEGYAVIEFPNAMPQGQDWLAPGAFGVSAKAQAAVN